MDLQDAALLIAVAILFVCHLLGKAKPWSDATGSNEEALSSADTPPALHKDELLLCDCLDVSLPYPPTLLTKDELDLFYLPLAPWAGAEALGKATILPPGRKSFSGSTGQVTQAVVVPRDSCSCVPPAAPDDIFLGPPSPQSTPAAELASCPSSSPPVGPSPPEALPLPPEPTCGPEEQPSGAKHVPAPHEPSATFATPSGHVYHAATTTAAMSAVAGADDDVTVGGKVTRCCSLEMPGGQSLPRVAVATPRATATPRASSNERAVRSTRASDSGGRMPATPRAGISGSVPSSPKAGARGSASGRTTPRSASPRVSLSGRVPPPSPKASSSGGGAGSGAKPPRSPVTALKAGAPLNPRPLRPPQQQQQPPQLTSTPVKSSPLPPQPPSPQTPVSCRQNHRYREPKQLQVQPQPVEAVVAVEQLTNAECREQQQQKRPPSTPRSRYLEANQAPPIGSDAAAPLFCASVCELPAPPPGCSAGDLGAPASLPCCTSSSSPPRASLAGSPSSVLRRAAEFEGLCRSGGRGGCFSTGGGAFGPPTPTPTPPLSSRSALASRRSLAASASFSSTASSASSAASCAASTSSSSLILSLSSSSEAESASNRSSISSLNSDASGGGADGSSSNSARNSSSGDGNISGSEDDVTKAGCSSGSSCSSSSGCVKGEFGLQAGMGERSASSSGVVVGHVGSGGSSLYSGGGSGGNVPLVRTSTRFFTSVGGFRSSGGGGGGAGGGRGGLGGSTAGISFLAFARATQMEAAAVAEAPQAASPAKVLVGPAAGLAPCKGTSSPPIGKRLAKPNMPRISGL